MGREIRRTPVGWEPPVVPPGHPAWGRNDRDWTGQGRWFQPQFDTSLVESQEEWDAEKAMWEAGTHPQSEEMLIRHSPGPYYIDRDYRGGSRSYRYYKGTASDSDEKMSNGRPRYCQDEGEPYRIYTEDGNEVAEERWFHSMDDVRAIPYEQFWTDRPGDDEKESYHPDWRGQELGYQFYETVTEGTPLSPSFAILQELEDWLVEQGHSREAAHAFCEQGWVPSMTMPAGGPLVSGIEQALL